MGHGPLGGRPNDKGGRGATVNTVSTVRLCSIAGQSQPARLRDLLNSRREKGSGFILDELRGSF